MFQIKTYNDPQDCRKLWEKLWPSDCFFDLWPVRSCFNAHFDRPLNFLVFEENHVPRGMMALSWLEEDQIYGHFPGETWKGKTWLEQNKIISCRPEMSKVMIEALPGSTHIRYLTHDSFFQTQGLVLQDEIGYLFFPKKYNYSFNDYLGEFSKKTRKKMNVELSKLECLNVSIQHNRIRDVDLFFRMNIETFGKDSYFSDHRFLQSFEQLISYLVSNHMIRITTILIGGKVAAIDIGALYNKTYTLLAGGTNSEFKGVAKLINLHHINWACMQKLNYVDFLCGDFNWKERFHLIPRPLYDLKIHKPYTVSAVSTKFEEQPICA